MLTVWFDYFNTISRCNKGQFTHLNHLCAGAVFDLVTRAVADQSKQSFIAWRMNCESMPRPPWAFPALSPTSVEKKKHNSFISIFLSD